MLSGGRHNDGGVRNACLREFLKRSENGNVAIQAGSYLTGAFGIDIHQRGQGTIPSLGRQFLDMQGMDLTHPADANYRDSERFRHKV
jgi:hypothetical protein